MDIIAAFTLDQLDGFKKLGGSGVGGGGYKGSRNVWAIDYNGIPAVVKLEFRGNDNRHEAECWAAVEGTELAQYFCPVLAHSEDYEWLVMERAKLVLCDLGTKAAYGEGIPYNYRVGDEAQTKEYTDFLEDMARACAENGIYSNDFHPGNFAKMNDGRIVCIDYGFFEVNGQEDDEDDWNDSRVCDCTMCRRNRSESEDVKIPSPEFGTILQRVGKDMADALRFDVPHDCTACAQLRGEQ